jgi:hypothetical protein
MPVNDDMRLISSVTVPAGGAASIDFTSIPGTYTDLVIQLSARSTGNFGGNDSMSDDCWLRFNSSSSGYSARSLYGYGSGVGSSNNAAQTYLKGFYIDGSGATASTFGNTSIYIPNYTSSNNKSVSGDSVSEHNATMAYMNLMAGLWANSSAITSITLTTANGNFAQYSTATLYGIRSSSVGATKATGGVISETSTHWIHTFNSSDTFTPLQNLTIDYLVVAGGGGGRSAIGGGGGAGGMRCTVGATGGTGSLPSAVSVTANNNYTVTVGGGGNNSQGSTSSITGSGFSTISCTGGGYGGTRSDHAGGPGGSGGGGGGPEQAQNNNTAGGAGTAGEGFNGGNGTTIIGNGGGGAGATPPYPPTTSNGGTAGGIGRQTNISGFATYYSGGGGGCYSYGGTLTGPGGLGGGGRGGGYGLPPTNGTGNTGGGGGGGGYAGAGEVGSTGGSGIVIVRYAK